MIKFFSAVILVSLAVIVSSANAETNMLFTEQGYPYKDLVNRSNEVKIIYSEKNNDVSCRVQVALNGTTWKTRNLQVEKREFDSAPLASCLERSKAKQILASTYTS